MYNVPLLSYSGVQCFPSISNLLRSTGRGLDSKKIRQVSKVGQFRVSLGVRSLASFLDPRLRHQSDF